MFLQDFNIVVGILPVEATLSFPISVFFNVEEQEGTYISVS